MTKNDDKSTVLEGVSDTVTRKPISEFLLQVSQKWAFP